MSSVFEVEMGNAYKVTLIRPMAQCDMGETDVYGCQQHVPLMKPVEIDRIGLRHAVETNMGRCCCSGCRWPSWPCSS